MKKIALKFCGGCDPTYDRSDYWRRLRDAAGENIEWARTVDGGCCAVVVISGCHRSCIEKEIEQVGAGIITVKDGRLSPEDLVRLLQLMA